MQIYLDMCSIQRPLDNKAQLRIAVEAEAILGIIALCEAGQVDLLASDALVFETTQNPHPVRQRHALEVLAKALLFVPTDRRVEERSRRKQIISAPVTTDSSGGAKRRTLGGPKSFLLLS